MTDRHQPLVLCHQLPVISFKSATKTQPTMNKDDIKTAVLGAIWAFEKSGYTNEELAEEVNRLLPWPAEETQKRTAQRNTELLADYIRDKEAVGKALGLTGEGAMIHRRQVEEIHSLKNEVKNANHRGMCEASRLRHKINCLETAMKHINEIATEKNRRHMDIGVGSTAMKSIISWSEMAPGDQAEPSWMLSYVTTYTKSYLSGEFGATSKPLDYITLKAGDKEIAMLPLIYIVEMVDDLREEIERYRMDHSPHLRHRFAPDKKYPWFCAQCGYPPDHPVMHLPQDAARGGASES
jgi:CRISPR/Cas system-associated exonuclease Cas4 (RecB family)